MAIRTARPRTPDSYTAAELKADLAIHSIGTLAGAVAVIVLLNIAIRNHGGPHFTAILVYAVGLLAMLGFSAAYNLTPPSRWKEALRRCDHGAIFLMIAGTYTPFVASIDDPRWRWGLMSTIWLTALAGLVTKLAFPRRLESGFVFIYLGLGWIALIALQPIFASLAASTISLLAAGGVLYTIGVVFHLWKRLRFHNAIWHALVVVAAGFHYFAVLFGVASASAG
ncbi:MAG TPA: hemolysin III family protein [Stellaceae bacterium]|nr:hemolysin III family protein [Stellaceae bacterium]